MQIFRNAQEAYLGSLEALRRDGRPAHSAQDSFSPGSFFGAKDRMMQELLVHCFGIAEPHDRLVCVPVRRTNPIFAVANALWILAGRDDLEFIQYYNQRGKDFSDDGATLYGAYGKRFFSGCRVNQIAGIEDRLKKDPSSRRALSVVVQPRDSVKDSRDLPCLVDIQFLYRDGALDMVSHMRSQSACMVLPYDLFALTFLHEAVAREMQLPLGIYRHVSTSFHYYDDEAGLVEGVLDSTGASDARRAGAPVMPTDSPFVMAQRVVEVAIQVQRGEVPPGYVTDLDLPAYWKELLLLLSLQSWRDNETIRDGISPYYRAALSAVS